MADYEGVNRPVLLLDNGTDRVKYGSSMESTAFRSTPNYIACGYDYNYYGRSIDAIPVSTSLPLLNPTENGFPILWEAESRIWSACFVDTIMGIDSSAPAAHININGGVDGESLCLSLPPFMPDKYLDTLNEISFEFFNVGSLYHSSSLSFIPYAFSKDIGSMCVIVDMGHSGTRTCVCVNGVPIKHTIKQTNVGGQMVEKLYADIAVRGNEKVTSNSSFHYSCFSPKPNIPTYGLFTKSEEGKENYMISHATTSSTSESDDNILDFLAGTNEGVYPFQDLLRKPFLRRALVHECTGFAAKDERKQNNDGIQLNDCNMKYEPIYPYIFNKTTNNKEEMASSKRKAKKTDKFAKKPNNYSRSSGSANNNNSNCKDAGSRSEREMDEDRESKLEVSSSLYTSFSSNLYNSDNSQYEYSFDELELEEDDAEPLLILLKTRMDPRMHHNDKQLERMPCPEGSDNQIMLKKNITRTLNGQIYNAYIPSKEVTACECLFNPRAVNIAMLNIEGVIEKALNEKAVKKAITENKCSYSVYFSDTVMKSAFNRQLKEAAIQLAQFKMLYPQSRKVEFLNTAENEEAQNQKKKLSMNTYQGLFPVADIPTFISKPQTNPLTNFINPDSIPSSNLYVKQLAATTLIPSLTYSIMSASLQNNIQKNAIIIAQNYNTIDQGGVIDCIKQSLECCPVEIQEVAKKSVIVTGGVARTNGFIMELQKRLGKDFIVYGETKLTSNNYDCCYTNIAGMRQFVNRGVYKRAAISHQEYDEYGSRICHLKFF